jgi:hypothetical protein
MLQSAETMLKAVEIRPGENPAHRIMREVVANKEKNNPANIGSYQYRVYHKIEFDMNNYGDKLSKRKALKPFNFMFDYADTTEDGKVFLPMAITENTSNIYYTKNPQRKQEVILGSRISGLQNSSVSQFLGDMYQNINIYDNFLLVFNRSFVSPVTDNFLRYYKYYLVDSVYIGEERCYKLLFLPKRKQDLTFTGDLYIHDKTFAVKQVNIRFNDQANINYIKQFDVYQEYERVGGTTWMLKKEKSMGDFAPFEKGDGIGIYGRKTTIYDKVIINPQLPDSLFKVGLQQFFTTYKYQNATSQDFAHLMDNLSPKDLAPFFNQWLYQVGHPQLKTRLFMKKGIWYFEVIQVQDELFTFPFQLKVSSDVAAPDLIEFQVTKRKQQFEIPREHTGHEVQITIDPHMHLLFEPVE